MSDIQNIISNFFRFRNHESPELKFVIEHRSFDCGTYILGYVSYNNIQCLRAPRTACSKLLCFLSGWEDNLEKPVRQEKLVVDLYIIGQVFCVKNNNYLYLYIPEPK